jgi:hypothetical protein
MQPPVTANPVIGLYTPTLLPPSREAEQRSLHADDGFVPRTFTGALHTYSNGHRPALGGTSAPSVQVRIQ